MSQVDEIKNKLQKVLSSKRYEHTLGVEYTCCALAMRYQEDLEKARIAGLLHDCAKYLTGNELLEECKKADLPVSREEEAFPELLHAKAGAEFAKKQYGIEDSDILSAITWHTTGRPDMSLLEKIVYIADYIEPNRNQAPRLKELRELAFSDLDLCLTEILSGTISYLKERGGVMDPMTIAAYEFYNGRN